MFKGWWGSEDRYWVFEVRPRVQHDLRGPLSQDMFFVLLGRPVDVVSNCNNAVRHDGLSRVTADLPRTYLASGELWQWWHSKAHGDPDQPPVIFRQYVASLG
jgi:hypothetical protein